MFWSETTTFSPAAASPHVDGHVKLQPHMAGEYLWKLDFAPLCICQHYGYSEKREIGAKFIRDNTHR